MNRRSFLQKLALLPTAALAIIGCKPEDPIHQFEQPLKEPEKNEEVGKIGIDPPAGYVYITKDRLWFWSPVRRTLTSDVRGLKIEKNQWVPIG
jgi:hypothetical protein